MERIFQRIAIALLVLFLAVGESSARQCALLRAAEGTTKTGCYIVVLKKATTAEQFDRILERATTMASDADVHGVVRTVSKAFAVKLSSYSLHALRQLPEVDYIEEETMAQGTQSFQSWHIDRLDQLQLPLDGSYNPIGDGEGVDIYVLDSGISYSHSEFENRAKYPGYDPMDVHLNENRQGEDCFGHGTHVASLAAGVTRGAAKKATVYSVRVLDCQNRGPWSTTLDGIDYVMRVIPERGRPAVVSMSLGGGFTRSVNDAVETLHASGIPVVVAAGNDQIDACSQTPASAPSAITVAGSSITDGLYFATNYGACVNIFAPGNSIHGANFTCPTCFKFLSGTSMSTPIVSGVIAIILQRQPLLTPQGVLSKLLEFSVSNSLDFRDIPATFRASTPNRVLSIPGSCGGTISLSPSSTSTTLQSPSYPSSYPLNVRCKWVIRSAPGTHAQVTFEDFSTEPKFDTVKLCSGEFCDDDNFLVLLSGVVSQRRRYESTSNVLSIELKTDGLTGSSGFQGIAGSVRVQSPVPIEVTPPPTTTTSPPAPPTPPSCQPYSLTPANITDALQETITEAQFLINQVVSSTLNNLLSMKLDEVDDIESTECPSIPAPTTEPPPQPTEPPPTEPSSTEPPCLGCASTNPAQSCREIALSSPSSPSGYYWLQASGRVITMYCDMTILFDSNGGGSSMGWMRIANLDMSDTNQDCPSGLGYVSTPLRTCGRDEAAPGCSSTFFSTQGLHYRRVCGRVIGYQYSAPNAFFAHQYDTRITIDDYYLDGVSLTRGQPRQHIWSFAATLDEQNGDRHICPCTHPDNSLPDSAVPPFIGNDYFCDSGTASYTPDVFFVSDPLWDGQGCGSESSCCSYNTPPWFCQDLVSENSDSVEMRICGNENTSNEDTPVQIVELYVQ